MTLASAPAAAQPPATNARLDGVALVALALVVNSLAARYISQPGYTDAYYYFGGARQLANGQGFTEPYLWNYLAPLRAVDPGRSLWPSHLYWMPLVSLVAAPAMSVAQMLAGGLLSNAALFRAAQLPFILLASGLPLLTYGVVELVGGARRHALAAALLTLFSPFYFVFWTTTDAFALYALAAAGALVLTAQAEKHPAQSSRWLLGAGLTAGLAHLTRADGVLLLICLLLWVAARPIMGPGWRPRLRSGAALLMGYGMIMAPWFWRNSVVAGAPLGLGGMRSIWLTAYDDLFTFSPERLSPSAYLAAGAGTILSGKWLAFLDNAQTVIAVQGGIVAFPFGLVGLWRLRRIGLIQLAALYGLALFAAMTLVFTFPGARGGYFHSGAALLPFFMAAAVVGLDVAVDGVATRLRHWQPARSKPIFTGLLIALAVFLTGLVFWRRVIGPDFKQPAWQASERDYAEAGAWLAAQGQGGALAAVNDPPGWNYWTTGPAIVIPNGDATVLSQAMLTYGARFVVLGANRPGALSGLYAAPQSLSMFVLRAHFTDSAGQPAYLLELVPEPG
jgi:hypothetical protein